MHVCLYSPVLPDRGEPNGVVTYVSHLRAALSDLGCQVSVVSRDKIALFDGRQVDVPDAPLIARSWSRLRGSAGHRSAEAITRAVKLVHRISPIDVFEMEESFGIARHVHAPCKKVVRLHGPWFLGCEDDERGTDDFRQRVEEEGRAIADADGVTSPSAKLLSDVGAFYGQTGKPTAAIPNPVGGGLLQWNSATCNLFHVVNVGRFDSRKGADLTIKAFAEVAKAHPLARLTMAGPDRGVLTPDGRRLKFAEYVAENLEVEIATRVLHVGSVDSTTLTTLRRSAAFCLVNSRFETFSYAAAEVLETGAPLIIADGYGIPELIPDGRSKFPIGDIDALVRTWTGYLGQRAQLADLAEEGSAILGGPLNPRNIASETLQFYGSL